MHPELKKFFYALVVVIAVSVFILTQLIQDTGQGSDVAYSITVDTPNDTAYIRLQDEYFREKYGLSYAGYEGAIKCLVSVPSDQDQFRQCLHVQFPDTIPVNDNVYEPVYVPVNILKQMRDSSSEDSEYIEILKIEQDYNPQFVEVLKIAKFVKETAAECNLPYYEYKTMRSAIIAHFKHLKELGKKPQFA